MLRAFVTQVVFVCSEGVYLSFFFLLLQKLDGKFFYKMFKLKDLLKVTST